MEMLDFSWKIWYRKIDAAISPKPFSSSFAQEITTFTYGKGIYIYIYIYIPDAIIIIKKTTD